MIKDIPGLLSKVEAEIKAFTDIAVVGLSGGADSTLVAILCSRALGRGNVFGVHMPYSESDVSGFNSRSKQLAKHLHLNDETINIKAAVDALCGEFFTAPSRLNQGNMRSRMRMVALYTMCCQLGEETGQRVRVVGTDNLSENYIAFFTKYGDGGVDFNPITTLFKSEVYQLLDYFIAQGVIGEEHVDRIPSAGLWEGQTDEGELQHSYIEMEQSIRRCMGGAYDDDIECDRFVTRRHINNQHKNESPPSIDLTDFLDHPRPDC